MRTTNRLIVIIAAIFLLGGAFALLWVGHTRFDLFGLRRANPPQIAWLEVARGNEPERPIRLAGASFQSLAGHMFYGFRGERGRKQIGNSGASWIVTIVDRDGTERQLFLYDRDGKRFWTAGISEHATEGDLGLILKARRGIELLDLGQTTDFQSLESAVSVDGDAAIDPLLELAESQDALQRVIGLRALIVILSPRVRRGAIDARGIIDTENVTEFQSPNYHPRAEEVRAVAMAIVNQWNSGTFSISEGSWLSGAALPVVTEFADQATTDALVEMLRERADADYDAEKLMGAIERIYGLPPFVEPVWFCSTGTSAEGTALAAKEALARRHERRRLLSAWHDDHRDAPPDERLELAVLAWESRIGSRHLYQMMGFPILLRHQFAPLVNQGTPIVPFLRAAQARPTDISHKANYEVLMALITGRYNPDLVAELNRGDPIHREMARNISAIARPTEP